METPGVELLAAMPAWTHTAAGLAVLALAVTLANITVKRVLLRTIVHGLRKNALAAADSTATEPIARHLGNIVPALFALYGIGLVPGLPAGAITIVRNCANAFIIITIVLALSACLSLAGALYQKRPEARSRPIKGYLQVVQIALFAFGGILAIAALMERSPVLLFSGLGAMAAVLMLVFKDTILSLVASVQLTSNDMIRVGDWIEMPQLNADGDVIDIALHTVKVQNWDKTVTSIPTYRLISESYKNWRGMSESGGRRIKRALVLDQSCARFLTSEERTALGRFALLKPYLVAKEQELARWNSSLVDRGLDSVNHRALTNVGTFRAYIQAYIDWHPHIHKDMTRLVRQLESSAEGLPLEIYCFTNTVAWHEYEAIQADLLDHLLAILPHFGLRLFQRPAGSDFRNMTAPRTSRETEFARAG
ncbi:MAG: mechanosensitive ion channel [Rhodospirillaceae bacterium]|nr:mechanosensitive ion channel [Rhodospirillaceae bacterium]